MKERYIGCVRRIVSHHVEQPGQLGEHVAVEGVVGGEGGLHAA